MISPALTATNSDPDDDQRDDIFEPHVAGVAASRALHVVRHAGVLPYSSGTADQRGAAAWAYSEATGNPALFFARHVRECSLRFVEAVATGTARSLGARSPVHLVGAQGELVHAYLNWLSFSLRACLPANLAAPETG
ncbi:hypothetical protein [Sphingobium tyrosinilyticum]|uniref:hypothetical protein n=1 Tax=Sphingobium tyrosinilyticum TaxID=2715436 RepID=UPI0036D2CDB6